MMDKVIPMEPSLIKRELTSHEEFHKAVSISLTLNGNHVTCTSPDSTVKTEIPADLRFPDFVDLSFPPDFPNDFANLVGSAIHTSESDNNRVSTPGLMAKVDSTGMISVEAPNFMDYLMTSENSDLVSLQPLQSSPSQIISQDQDTSSGFWSPNRDASEGTWSNQSTSIVKLEGLGSAAWVSPAVVNSAPNSPVAIIAPKKEVGNSQLKNLLLGDTSSYNKKADTLLALLKQPYNPQKKPTFSSSFSEGDDRLSSPGVTFRQPAPGITNSPTSSTPSHQLTLDVQTNKLEVSHAESTVDTSAIFGSVSSCSVLPTSVHPTNISVGSTPVNTSTMTISGSSINYSPVARPSFVKRSSLSPHDVSDVNGISSSASSNLPSSSDNIKVKMPSMVSLSNGISRSVSTTSRQKVRTRTPAHLKKDGGRLHPCTICTKSFKDRFSLEAHFRIHTGERPFKCSICGKGFKQKAHMQKHSTMHLASPRDRIPVSRSKREYGRTSRKLKNGDRHLKKSDGSKELGKPDSNYNHVLYNDIYSDSNVSTTTSTHGEELFDLSALDKSQHPSIKQESPTTEHYGTELYRRLTSRPTCSKSSPDPNSHSMYEPGTPQVSTTAEVDVISSFSGDLVPDGDIKSHHPSTQIDVPFSPFSDMSPKSGFTSQFSDEHSHLDDLHLYNTSNMEVDVKEDSLQSNEDVLTFTLVCDRGDSMDEDQYSKLQVKFFRLSKSDAEEDPNMMTFECSLCRRCFDSRQEMIEHVKSHGRVYPVKMEVYTEEVYPCLNCGKQYTHNEYLLHPCLVGV